jgi:prolyl oligopeptidase
LERTIEAPQLGSASGVSGEWDSPESFTSFSSFNVPSTIHRVDVATGRRTTWAAVEVPFDGKRFVVEQVWFASKDGTKIPMFLAHARSAKRDGSNPLLLTGYGGFRGTELPYFSSKLAAWLDMGGIVAMPSLRGGAEFGEDWHRAGMLDRKQNVFDDFLGAAQWLVDQGWTRPRRMAIQGTSNGGLLVGASLVQRPDLFGAVVIGYPLLDMLRYHRFLVAKFWVPEYGSADDPGQFPALMAYSPYHHVEKGVHYPATLLVTGDSDTRVDPLHARKMTAMLQWAQGGDAPILLHYDQKAGHSGGTPAGKQVEDLADELGFLTWQLGMDEKAAAVAPPRRNPPR